jgi:NOL1/NOP2/fmu family ribosome biogenesis protein
VQALLEEVFQIPPEEKIVCSGGRLFVPPAGLPELSGLGVIRTGLLLGEIRTGRVEPAHALFLAAKPEMLRNALDFPSDSRQIRAFLHGEELETDPSLKGYAGVAVDGVLTGFGKCSGGRLKNRYPKGLRIY